jgi:hypothetical protein
MDELHQDGVLGDHGRTSEESVFGHPPSSEAFRVGSSPDVVFSIYDQASPNQAHHSMNPGRRANVGDNSFYELR